MICKLLVQFEMRDVEQDSLSARTIRSLLAEQTHYEAQRIVQRINAEAGTRMISGFAVSEEEVKP